MASCQTRRCLKFPMVLISEIARLNSFPNLTEIPGKVKRSESLVSTGSPPSVCQAYRRCAVPQLHSAAFGASIRHTAGVPSSTPQRSAWSIRQAYRRCDVVSQLHSAVSGASVRRAAGAPSSLSSTAQRMERSSGVPQVRRRLSAPQRSVWSIRQACRRCAVPQLHSVAPGAAVRSAAGAPSVRGHRR